MTAIFLLAVSLLLAFMLGVLAERWRAKREDSRLFERAYWRGRTDTLRSHGLDEACLCMWCITANPRIDDVTARKDHA